ncbi:hypothetical protein [Cupriavidus sp. USMAHM13]|uniref:hypothetical protein n=1 Tax=Cupriavidus sp. USMAHM13 TaxID=1389192 RepID=UPI0012EAE59B|nr:hypothetical protein [Cupriavidus sp. USMAHM13]
MQNTREISKARRAARAAAHATEKRAKDAGAERAVKAMLRAQRDLLKARAAKANAPVGLSVSDITRDANRLGPAFNRPLTPRGAGVYTVTTACTATL